MPQPRRQLSRDLLMLAAITLAGLALRLLVWRWREFQPLGGDEQEYFNQALTLLREWRYEELLFMRPPLYTLFLAASIYLVDSLVQNLRLVQALVSTASIPLVYLLTLELARWHGPAAARRAALLAAGLAALSYTLAANATELLSETLFLFGLTGVLWLLLRAARTARWPLAALAGLGLGALALVRSVALPLLPLGALWLLVGVRGRGPVVSGQRTADSGHEPGAGGECRGDSGQRSAVSGHEPGVRGQHKADLARLDQAPGWKFRLQPQMMIVFVCAALLVILPWTTRNYLIYGGLILIDTTGAENLWLDNDPAGREAVKAQLYAMGNQRLARQQLAAQRGREVILDDPARFGAKAWGELLKFFALEQSDDMLARRAIWVSPAETWTRLLLGDLHWLIMLLAGSYGLARMFFDKAVLAFLPQHYGTANGLRSPSPANGRGGQGVRASLSLQPVLRSTFYVLRSPAWLMAAWALYVLLTTLIFHVELRYRLPLYPVLLAYAGLTLAGALAAAAGRRARSLASLVAAGALALTLLHAPYPALAWQLGGKHWQLGRAEAALARGDLAAAERAGAAALARDQRSALARIVLARVALAAGGLPPALELLDAATLAVPEHAQAHVLRGDLRRALGEAAGARADLAYETASRQDLRAWLWARTVTPAPARLELGDGLDLGFVRGVHGLAPGEAGLRWTTERATLRLSVPLGARELVLRLASGRPADAPPVQVELWADGLDLGSFSVAAAWQELRVPLARASGELQLELRAPSFTPRDFDPASPDGRRLGVQLDWVEVR